MSAEKRELLSSIRDRHTQRKFVHLTRKGEHFLGLLHGTLGANDGTFQHDSCLSVVTRKFLEFDAIVDVELEHDIVRGRRVGRSPGHIPDAILYGRRGDTGFTVALELELTAKEKSRYIEKCRYYLGSMSYDYALYLFTDLATLHNYQREILKRLGSEAGNKILLSYNPYLHKRDVKFDETRVFYMNQEVRIGEII